jgi:Tol biopolymer transport system component
VWDTLPIAGVDDLESCPSWSPDETRLVLSRFPVGGTQFYDPGVITVRDMAGVKSETVAAGYQASWSPSGEWIAYVSIEFDTVGSRVNLNRPDGTRRKIGVWIPVVRLVRPDGTGDHEVYASNDASTYGTGDRMRTGSPWGPLVWSPDGSRLAFSRQYPTGSSIWVLGITSDGLKEISSRNASSFHER